MLLMQPYFVSNSLLILFQLLKGVSGVLAFFTYAKVFYVGHFVTLSYCEVRCICFDCVRDIIGIWFLVGVFDVMQIEEIGD